MELDFPDVGDNGDGGGGSGEVARRVLFIPPEVVKKIVVEHVEGICWPCLRFVCRTFNELIRHAIMRHVPETRPSEVGLLEPPPLEDVPWIFGSYPLPISDHRPWDFRSSLVAPSHYADLLARRRDLFALLKWARKEGGCRWWASTMQAAAEAGHVEVVEWLFNEACPFNGPRLCAGAAVNGHLAVLEWARTTMMTMTTTSMTSNGEGGGGRGCVWWDERACAAAARGGHLEVLQWLRRQGCVWDKNTCIEAARAGHFEVLRWAFMAGCPCRGGHMEVAAESGRVEIVEWLRDQGLRFTQAHQFTTRIEWFRYECLATTMRIEKMFSCAAISGRMEMLEWTVKQEPRLAYMRIWAQAAVGGHLDLLDFIHAIQPIPRFDAPIIQYVAYRGRLEVLEWMESRASLELTSQTLPFMYDAAAVGGHLAMVEWLAARGGMGDATTCVYAAVRGHVEVVEWLLAKGYAPDPFPSSPLTRPEIIIQRFERHLACLFVSEHGRSKCRCTADAGAMAEHQRSWTLYPFVESFIIAAVQADRRHLIEWACLTLGPRVGEMAAIGMAFLGKLDMFKWAMTGDLTRVHDHNNDGNGNGGGEDEDEGKRSSVGATVVGGLLCAMAIYGRHLKVVRWLREVMRCRWDERSCEAAAATGQLETLRWLRAKGCPWGARCCMMAARRGHLRVVKWLVRNGCPWNERRTEEEAEREGHHHVVCWIRTQALHSRKRFGQGVALHTLVELFSCMRQTHNKVTGHRREPLEQ